MQEATFTHCHNRTNCALSDRLANLAMAAASSDSGPNPDGGCPVLKAWGSNETLKTRLVGNGGVVIVSDVINRQSVLDNRELLRPLVQQVGTSAE